MKKSFKIVSIALAGALACGLFSGCDLKKEKEAAGYLSVDINPSVSFILDKNDRVLSVVADNEDGQVLLYEEEFEGLKVEKALEKLAKLSVDLGYLNEENRGVSVTGNLNGVENTAQSVFQAAVTKAGGEYSVNITTDGVFTAQRQVSEINEAYGLELTVGEYELIVQAQESDKTLTLQEAAAMKQEELLAIVYEGVDEYLPYATEAYTKVKDEAFRVYYKAKEELLNGLWTIPYLNIVKYPSLNGLVYGTYSAATVAMEVGLRVAEAAVKVAEKTAISKTVTDKIAVALGFDEEGEKTAFDEAIKGEDGKVTLASLEKYLNAYFKNMTADERAAAKAAFEQAMLAAKEAAASVYAQIDEEKKDAIEEMLEELEDAIPDQLKLTAQGVIAEYKSTLQEMRQAMTGKEPMAAAYAALEALQAAKAELLETMKNELEAGGDLENVQKGIDGAKTALDGFESVMKEKIEKAEESAKAYLANLKQNRQAKAQA